MKALRQKLPHWVMCLSCPVHVCIPWINPTPVSTHSSSPPQRYLLSFLLGTHIFIHHFLLGTGLFQHFWVFVEISLFIAVFLPSRGPSPRVGKEWSVLTRCFTTVTFLLLTAPCMSVSGGSISVPPTLCSQETEAGSPPLRHNLP